MGQRLPCDLPGAELSRLLSWLLRSDELLRIFRLGDWQLGLQVVGALPEIQFFHDILEHLCDLLLVDVLLQLLQQLLVDDDVLNSVQT